MDYCPLNNKPCSNSKNINISHLSNGKIENIDVCQCCMSQNKNDPLLPPSYLKLINMIDNMIERKNLTCCTCNTKFSDIIKKTRYGCGDCYKTFREQSINIFDKCQTGTKHIGKIPKNWEQKFLACNSSIQIALLNEQLKKAVVDENYEDAALIQKKIKEIQTAKEKS